MEPLNVAHYDRKHLHAFFILKPKSSKKVELALTVSKKKVNGLEANFS